jgi:CRISPR-associated endonuclease Cas1
MAATQTVPELLHTCKSPAPIVPQHGVVTVYGFGIKVYVERGHLTIEDGIGPDRRKARLPRVGHGMRRLVLIGSDGFVSLSAIRWLADQDVSFMMLERDGSVLATTGPVHASDARLRRAQSLAHHSGLALHIATELIRRKLTGQENVARSKLGNSTAADAITTAILALGRVRSVEAVSELEARAANAYWLAWRNVPIQFPSRDLRRVPEHWRKFGTRKSLLTNSPRLATNPPNAMLNYLYAILEAESRLALAALGLDPGIGVLHFDSRSRDSLACDLMEAVRPQVDAYVLDWIMGEPLRRDWFFERHDGNCRLMTRFTAQLSMTAEMWRRAVAPVAEWVSRALWSTLSRQSHKDSPATRLTQTSRREAKGWSIFGAKEEAIRIPRLCRTCGNKLGRGKRECASCAKLTARENLTDAAKLGRLMTHSPKAEALRAATQRRHAAELQAWKPSDSPAWLTEQAYRDKVQPRLLGFTVPNISAALGISEPYATDIRAGKRVPHPRHWLALVQLVGVLPDNEAALSIRDNNLSRRLNQSVTVSLEFDK